MGENKEIRPSMATNLTIKSVLDRSDLRPEIRVSKPPNTKIIGGSRSDWKPDEFDKKIAAQGYRCWWSRASICPCKSNEQTDQPDPMCLDCKGRGWTYGLPSNDLVDGGMDNAGNIIEFSPDGKAIAIRAIIAAMTSDPQVYEKFGQWILGSCRVTTFRHNRLGYMDRIIMRQSTVALSQLVESNGQKIIPVTGKRSKYGIWAPITEVVFLKSSTTNYLQDNDFSITDEGTIEWKIDPPEKDTRLSLTAHYIPRLVIQDHTFSFRDAMVSHKQQSASEEEQFQRLPNRAMAKLEFLAEE